MYSTPSLYDILRPVMPEKQARELAVGIVQFNPDISDLFRDALKACEVHYYTQPDADQPAAKTRLGTLYERAAEFVLATKGRNPDRADIRMQPDDLAVDLARSAYEKFVQVFGADSKKCADLRERYPKLMKFFGPGLRESYVDVKALMEEMKGLPIF
ncbi:hypothetical protein HYV81_01905 [Candidatus Woesearchaeota archaeon]|nr:hypothetical protein [Candidatus Woesearchaeota archaeon]